MKDKKNTNYGLCSCTLPLPVKPVEIIPCCIWYFFHREWDFSCHFSFLPDRQRDVFFLPLMQGELMLS